MMFGDVRVVDRVAAPIAGLPPLGSDGSMMKRHDSQHSGRPRATVRAPAHAVAFSTGVAAGYDRNGPGSHLTSAIWQGTLCPRKEVKMILKAPHARAA